MVEELRKYLESSTVHGLVYISTTTRLWKCFWILVVTSGFMSAGYLIQVSFRNWQDNPIRTTIETLPISEVEFPKISVCPPKDTYTNLNFDLLQSKNMSKFSENVRNVLMENFIHHFQQLDYEKHQLALQKSFKEDNRYKNWYTGNR